MGSDTCRAGTCDEDKPSAVFPCVTGKVKDQKSWHATSLATTLDEADTLVGDAALVKRALLDISSPIARRFVVDWAGLEAVWTNVYNSQLRLPAEEHPAMLSEPPNTPKPDRERLTRMMFETFSVPSMYLADQATLCLYAAGKTTGVVVDCGATVTRCVDRCERSCGWCCRRTRCRCFDALSPPLCCGHSGGGGVRVCAIVALPSHC